MEIVLNAIFSIPYIIYLNLIKRSKIKFPQSFGRRTRINLKGSGASIQIEKKCVTRDNVCFRVEGGGKLHIGKKCFINRNTTITCIDSIMIGAGTQIANNVTIIDHDHNYKEVLRAGAPFTSAGIEIGDNVWIGANCVILKGSKIGSGSVIGAGTIVKGEIEENTVCYQERKNTVKRICYNHE